MIIKLCSILACIVFSWNAVPTLIIRQGEASRRGQAYEETGTSRDRQSLSRGQLLTNSYHFSISRVSDAIVEAVGGVVADVLNMIDCIT